MTLSPSGSPPAGRLGTFAGVFTPSVLTILGIILFLRLGFVVGSTGLGRALAIIALANLISVLTSVSLSAVATNLKVKGGGDYYLISRTLGVEFGGAIGLVLFMAQAVSIAFYCIGFGEAVGAMLPAGSVASPRIIAAAAVSFLFVFAWLGADWATRFQYVVMALLAAALLSFFSGGISLWRFETLSANWAAPAGGSPFWVLFAIFFPAVTGFTQGVSMSGDLRDPGKSLPRGTFLAVGVSIVVYFSAAVIFAGAVPAAILSREYGAMKGVAAIGILIDAGVIAATLSSAMASFLGAPRILQSLAGDRIFSILLPFAKGAGASGNPRRGTLLSAGIAYGTIALGNLNVIAPVVSMFFLISYGLLNYATYYEARSFSPSFRPRFRWFDYRLSLLGSIACLGAMLAIDLETGLIAVSILFGLYQYIKRTAGPARWAASQRSHSLQRIRELLLDIASEPEHPRDWRPQILAFSDDPERRIRLLRFAEWLEGRSGLTTVVRVLEGEGVGMPKKQEAAENELREDLLRHDLHAFPLVLFSPDLQAGIQSLVQSFGIGPLKANTLLFNWLGAVSKDGTGFRELRFGGYLRAAYRLGCNIVLLDSTPEEWEALSECLVEGCRIDVWWVDDPTGRLMLLLAYLMTRSETWEEARIRIIVSRDGRPAEALRGEITQTLQDVRIDAEIEIVEGITTSVLKETSSDAAMVYLPFRFRSNQVMTSFGGTVDEALDGLPMTALVTAAERIDLEAAPEEGKAGEIAAAQDALDDARKKMAEAEKAAVRAAEVAEDMERILREVVDAPGDEATTEKASADVEDARKASDGAFRKAAKMKARVEEAAQELEALGGNASEDKAPSPVDEKAGADRE